MLVMGFDAVEDTRLGRSSHDFFAAFFFFAVFFFGAGARSTLGLGIDLSPVCGRCQRLAPAVEPYRGSARSAASCGLRAIASEG
jgi:hypothetical protein